MNVYLLGTTVKILRSVAPGYDDVHNIVVQANDETEARQLAHDKQLEASPSEPHKAAIWLNPKFTDCLILPLLDAGGAGVLCADIWEG